MCGTGVGAIGCDLGNPVSDLLYGVIGGISSVTARNEALPGSWGRGCPAVHR
jgi:hypothetical protein